MMKRDERFIRLAYENTFKSNHNKFPMSAVLVSGSRILSIGTNKPNKTHPRQMGRMGNNGYFRSPIHAEFDCLIRAPEELIEGSTIYIARHKKNLDFGLAKPCSGCYSVLAHYKVKRAVFTLDQHFNETPWYEEIYF